MIAFTLVEGGDFSTLEALCYLPCSPAFTYESINVFRKGFKTNLQEFPGYLVSTSSLSVFERFDGDYNLI